MIGIITLILFLWGLYNWCEGNITGKMFLGIIGINFILNQL